MLTKNMQNSNNQHYFMSLPRAKGKAEEFRIHQGWLALDKYGFTDAPWFLEVFQYSSALEVSKHTLSPVLLEYLFVVQSWENLGELSPFWNFSDTTVGELE